MSALPELLSALDFAAQRHSGQRRKGPDAAPYVNHLIEVASLLSRVAKVADVELLMAAVLHDVLEDTATSAAEVEARFGERVRALVEALSDDKSLPRSERRRQVLEHLPSASREVKLLKLADLTSNMQLLPGSWSAEQKREYWQWSTSAAALCSSECAELAELYQERAARARLTLDH